MQARKLELSSYVVLDVGAHRVYRIFKIDQKMTEEEFIETINRDKEWRKHMNAAHIDRWNKTRAKLCFPYVKAQRKRYKSVFIKKP